MSFVTGGMGGPSGGLLTLGLGIASGGGEIEWEGGVASLIIGDPGEDALALPEAEALFTPIGVVASNTEGHGSLTFAEVGGTNVPRYATHQPVVLTVDGALVFKGRIATVMPAAVRAAS